MSWEDQGRQEHGWFGNGTAPPKLDDGASKAKGDRLVLTVAELDRRIHAAIEAARRADAAAAQAHAWVKRFGPVLFGLPRSGPVLEEFADAVARIERARPGTLRQGLESGIIEQARAATSDGMLMPVQFTTNFKHACRVLRLNLNAASDALHAAKRVANVGNADDCTFDLKNGDILFNDEIIGNLRD